jgi:hypothetical protein
VNTVNERKISVDERIKSLVLLDLDTGEWKDGRLPLHVSVTPPFFLLDEEIPEFSDELDMALRGIEEFEIIAGKKVYFGDDHDRLARRMGGRGLHALHRIAMEIASNYYDDIPRTYTDDHYSPHVTFKDGRGVEKNARILVDEVTFAVKRLGWRAERDFFLYEEADNER